MYTRTWCGNDFISDSFRHDYLTIPLRKYNCSRRALFETQTNSIHKSTVCIGRAHIGTLNFDLLFSDSRRVSFWITYEWKLLQCVCMHRSIPMLRVSKLWCLADKLLLDFQLQFWKEYDYSCMHKLAGGATNCMHTVVYEHAYIRT